MGPLKEIKIVEFAMYAFAPVAAMHLGDLGADIIKIEAPGRGEAYRGLLSVGHLPATEFAYPYEYANRNKRSIVIDLKHERGRELAHKLLAEADIFITNYVPSRLERLGLDYETVSRINPRIIFALFTGYGLKGPDKDKINYDMTAWARAGIQLTMAQPGRRPPGSISALVDYSGAAAAVGPILAALYHRDRTGIGQQVHISLFAIGPAVMASLTFQGVVTTGRNPLPRTGDNPANPFMNVFLTKNGKWIQLNLTPPDRYRAPLFRALGLEHLIGDPRFVTHKNILDRSAELVAILDDAFATKTLEEWRPILDEHELVWAHAQSMKELLSDPQLLANDNVVVTYDHPRAGRVKYVGFPAELSKTPASIRRPAPEFGEHTEEILLELGYTWQDIEQLKGQEVTN